MIKLVIRARNNLDLLIRLVLPLLLILIIIIFFLFFAYLTQDVSIEVWFDAVELVQDLIIEILRWDILILLLYL